MRVQDIDVGDVRVGDTTEGLAEDLRGMFETRTRSTTEAKTEQHHNDADLLEFCRKPLSTGVSPCEDNWTGEKGKKNLESGRSFTYTDWQVKLIEPNIEAGNMTVKIWAALLPHRVPSGSSFGDGEPLAW